MSWVCDTCTLGFGVGVCGTAWVNIIPSNSPSAGSEEATGALCVIIVWVWSQLWTRAHCARVFVACGTLGARCREWALKGAYIVYRCIINAGAHRSQPLRFGAMIYVIYLRPDGSKQGPSIKVKRLLSNPYNALCKAEGLPGPPADGRSVRPGTLHLAG